MSEEAEQTFASGVFGTVTNKRVIYQRAKGWFSGGSHEDFPLKHVTSVRLETTRHILGGVLFALIGLGCLGAPGGGKLIGAALTALAVLLLWGSPAVVVNTAGQDKNAARAAGLGSAVSRRPSWKPSASSSSVSSRIADPAWVRADPNSPRNKVRASYNYAEHLPERRRRMMRASTDYLDEQRDRARKRTQRKAPQGKSGPV